MEVAFLIFPALWGAFALWSIADKIGRIEKLLEKLAEPASVSSTTSSRQEG